MLSFWPDTLLRKVVFGLLLSVTAFVLYCSVKASLYDDGQPSIGRKASTLTNSK